MKRVLVSLAVLAVLAVGGVRLRSFAEARRENARRASCLSDIRQSASFFFTYVQNHGGRYPIVHPGAEDAWAVELADCVRHPDVLWCPDDPLWRRYQRSPEYHSELSLRQDVPGVIQLRRRRIGRATSYVMNPKLSGVLQSSISDPANTILLTEIGTFHEGQTIVAYADGRSRAIKRPPA